MTAGVLVLHAWWGLNDDVRAVSGRLRDTGLDARTVDLYDGTVTTGIDEAERLSSELDFGTALGHLEDAAADLRRSLPDGAPLFLWGYSLGGSIALRVAASLGATGVVTFYGSVGPNLDAAPAVPTIGHFAEVDEFVDAEDIAALRKTGTTAEIYPGTRHWFAEPSRPEYRRDAADLTLDRSLAFLAERS